jgi:Family of unknown function (DUF5681)
VSDRTANLKPWPKGVSGNPGGRPKTKPITEELQRLLAEERPSGNGQTWATAIAEALLRQASLGKGETLNRLDHAAGVFCIGRVNANKFKPSHRSNCKMPRAGISE